MPSVLFVCTANICRSPLAMGLFRAKLGADASGWKIASAGTWAEAGQAASTKTVQVLEERGIKLLGHASQIVSHRLLSEYNLILTMESGHKEALQAEFPDQAGKIYMLSEMVGRRYDIADPYGGSLLDYRDAAREIEQILTQGYARIVELAGA
jgi:protein-tyrosine phosphatase